MTLVVVYVITALLNENFLGGYNQSKLLERTGLYGILSLGVAFVIITRGIDLSIGSVVSMASCLTTGMPLKDNVSFGGEGAPFDPTELQSTAQTWTTQIISFGEAKSLDP